MIEKSNKTLYLLSCQALTIFLCRYYSVRPFPYEQMIAYLDLFESEHGKIFRTSNKKTLRIDDKTRETVLKNRCVFINLHIDFIFELMRFATMDRSEIVVSKEIHQFINTIHGYAYSIFFSTYLRYLMDIFRQSNLITHLSIDKFLEVTKVVLSSCNDFKATRTSLIMIFPKFIAALMTLNKHIWTDNHNVNLSIVEEVIINLIEICTLDFGFDFHEWKGIISKGLKSITDCSINSLIVSCSTQQNNIYDFLTSLWLLCSIVCIQTDNSGSSIRDDIRIALLEGIEKMCCNNLIDNLVLGPTVFCLKFINLLKLLMDMPDELICNSSDFLKDLLAKLCSSQFTQLCPELSEYLLLKVSILKMLNHDSFACMNSSQLIIYQSFTNINLLCGSDLFQIMNCNRVDLMNVMIVFFRAIFNGDLQTIDSLDWTLASLIKQITKPILRNQNLKFVEHSQKQLINFLWSIPEELHSNSSFNIKHYRIILWRLLNAVFIFSEIYHETVPLSKITSLMIEYLMNESTIEMEKEFMYKLILKVALNDTSFNIRSQLVAIFINDNKGRSTLSLIGEENAILTYRKLTLLAVLNLSTPSKHDLDHLNRIKVLGKLLLQCVDHCCKTKTPLTEICGLIIIQEVFRENSLIETNAPCLLEPDNLLKITSILYTIILDRSSPSAREIAIKIFGQILRLCTLKSEYMPVAEQIVSSVWIEILVRNIQTESAVVHDTGLLYNATWINFLNQLLEFTGDSINFALSPSIWRAFSVWFVQHSIKDLPKDVTRITCQLIAKVVTHPKLNCFNEAERICLLKKLSTETSYLDEIIQVQDSGFAGSTLLQIIHDVLDF